MKTTRKRVYVVDDHPMVREGLAAIINQQPDLVLCGGVATAAEALAGIPKAKPDVIIVDLSLGGRSGLELVRTLRVNYPKLPVIVHTMHIEQLYAQRAYADGAFAYVTKAEPPTRLISELRRAVAGKTVTTHQHKTAPHSSAASLELGKLSDRELEVFELRGQGMTGDHIAARLHLSRKTVDCHLEHIKHKLALKNSAAVLQQAVEWMRSRQAL